jgi:hypothetical protein
MRRIVGVGLSLALLGTMTVEAEAASLRGSRASMIQQNQVAKEHGLDFHRTADDIRAAVARGDLVELKSDENYEVADFVSFPYLQPAVALFIERLSAQYREACGQKLVVTSAVRPGSRQPSNAHQLSVHPAGMAVDLRVSDRAECRGWLEGALLNLERRGVLNGIREFHPPHYHVAVFPEQYLAYVEERVAAEAQRQAEPESAVTALAQVPGAAALLARGDQDATEEPGGRTGLATVLALILAVPVGLGVLFRRKRQR